jgi:hypothetical protein
MEAPSGLVITHAFFEEIGAGSDYRKSVIIPRPR